MRLLELKIEKLNNGHWQLNVNDSCKNGTTYINDGVRYSNIAFCRTAMNRFLSLFEVPKNLSEAWIYVYTSKRNGRVEFKVHNCNLPYSYCKKINEDVDIGPKYDEILRPFVGKKLYVELWHKIKD